VGTSEPPDNRDAQPNSRLQSLEPVIGPAHSTRRSPAPRLVHSRRRNSAVCSHRAPRTPDGSLSLAPATGLVGSQSLRLRRRPRGVTQRRPMPTPSRAVLLRTLQHQQAPAGRTAVDVFIGIDPPTSTPAPTPPSTAPAASLASPGSQPPGRAAGSGASGQAAGRHAGSPSTSRAPALAGALARHRRPTARHLRLSDRLLRWICGPWTPKPPTPGAGAPSGAVRLG
jgi:hypothetical protein